MKRVSILKLSKAPSPLLKPFPTTGLQSEFRFDPIDCMLFPIRSKYQRTEDFEVSALEVGLIMDWSA